MADEEDAADIIISLGAAASLPGLMAAEAASCPSNSAAVGFRLSQSAASSTSLDDDNEAYDQLRSRGITVSKAASSTDIL